jgi:sulfotransferase
VITKLHLISGLPRAGSTLLCALLRQNPRFIASVTSPVASMCELLRVEMSGSSEFVTFFDDQKRMQMLRAIFEGYYNAAREHHVVFDTNRTWTAKSAWIGRLFPDARIICCVREVGWIIDSVERILRANPLQLSHMFGFKPGTSIYSRLEVLMNSDSGLIGMPWSALRESWFAEDAKRLIVIPYDTLVREPERTLRRLYDALGEKYFAHDTGHVSYDEPLYDAQLGMPGLHKVRPVIEMTPRTPSIPPDIFAKYTEANFWLNPSMNVRGVLIL